MCGKLEKPFFHFTKFESNRFKLVLIDFFVFDANNIGNIKGSSNYQNWLIEVIQSAFVVIRKVQYKSEVVTKSSHNKLR